MNLQQRLKYMGHGRTVNKSNIIIDIEYDVTTLIRMCSYAIYDNGKVKRGLLMNMRNLFSMINPEPYAKDGRIKYFNAIKSALEARIEKGLKDPELIIKYVNGGFMEDNEENTLSLKDLPLLSSDECVWISETISESLKYSFLYKDIEILHDLTTRFKAADYRNKGEIVSEIEEEIIKISNLFRKARVENSQEVTFSLKNGDFQDAIYQIHDELTNPRCRLFTGMQGFNKLVGGAFETQRVYMLMGLAGAGKSLSLLNIAKQLKTHNKQYKTKDPTKIPVIVLLTQENTVKESVERLFEISTGEDIKNFDPETAMEMFRTQGELYLNDESPIDIIIKYVPNRSVDTSYLYTLTEDLEDEGYEVICLIQDHIKRIRSVERDADIRLELGNIVNEFKTFAMLKDCVVITNGHLNRDAIEKIKAESSDPLEYVTAANIGESMLIIDNLDCAIIIGRAEDAQGNSYMGFKRVKERFKAPLNFNIVYQMFESPESIRLVEDIDRRVPIYKTNLKEDANSIAGTSDNINRGNSTSTMIKDTIGATKSIATLSTNISDSIFDTGTTRIFNSNNIAVNSSNVVEMKKKPIVQSKVLIYDEII